MSKVYLIPILLLALSLAGCSAATPATPPVSQVDISNLRTSDADMLDKISQIQKSVDSANAKIDSLSKQDTTTNKQVEDINAQLSQVKESVQLIQAQIKLIGTTNNPEIAKTQESVTQLQTNISSLQSQIDILNQKLTNITVTPTPTSTTSGTGLEVTITRSSATINDIEAGQEYSADFIFKMRNTSAVMIDQIEISGRISFSESLEFEDDYLTLTDTVIPPIIYDLHDIDDKYVDWKFWRSTGEPTDAHIDAGDTFVFHLRMTFATTEDIDKCKFTLKITDVTWEGK